MLKKVLTLLIKIILFTKVQLIPEKFVNPNGTKVTADSFLSTTGDQIVAGTITVQNSDGVTTDPNTDLEQKVIGDTFAMTQTVTDNDPQDLE